MVTRVIAFHRGLEKESMALKVSSTSLRTMKRPATERGVGGSARKYGANLAHQPVTSNEDQWLSEMMVELLKRSGRLAAGARIGAQLPPPM
jgi:D-arabinose 1-dehydrogenase-like Zn-dependent alcohol dehydrogenase